MNIRTGKERAAAGRASPGTRRRGALAIPVHQVRALREQVRLLEDELKGHRKQQARTENHPIAFIELLPKGTVRDANETAVTLLGGDKEKVLLSPMRRFVEPDDLAAFYRHIHHCTAAGQAYASASHLRRVETEISLRTGGHWMRVRLVSKMAEKKGRVTVIPTAIVDLTEAGARQVLLMSESENLHRLIDSIDGIVWEADFPFQLRFVSRQFETILGYSTADWKRRPSFWQDRIHVDDRERVMQERESAVRARTQHITEYRMRTARNEIVWLRESVSVIQNSLGHSRLLGLAVNVTEVKRAEEAARRAHEQTTRQAGEHKRHLDETIRSMETFCYGIAHELRAPVRTMQGFGELLLEQPDHLRREDYLRRITAAANRMDALIADLLAYGRLHHTDMLIVPTAVSQIVDRVLEVLSADIEKAQARVTVTLPQARVMAHPMLLIQAVQNLVSNALKFVRPGVTPEVQIYTRSLGSMTRLCVRDNGIGVNPECREKIFGLFERAHSESEYPGSGIGLAIVNRIVELLNSRAGVDPLRPHGSCFWIELPSAP